MSWDVSYLRHSSTTSQTLYYPAGVATNTNATANFARDQVLFMPWLTGHGGSIVGVALSNAIGSNVQSRVIRVALYALNATDDPHPGTLFADMGSFIADATGFRTAVTPIPQVAHTALWLAVMANSQYSVNRVTRATLPAFYGPAPRNDISEGDQVLVMSWGWASGFPATCPRSTTFFNGLGFPPIALAVSSIEPT
jgi:hypothetical protein